MVISYRLAQIEEAHLIVNLINSAYRGETSKLGWTTEANLLEGVRTTQEEILSIIQNDHNLLLLSFEKNQLVGCILAEKLEHCQQVRFGMFVTQPTLQGRGLGKCLLAYAEQFVEQTWNISQFEMIVISCRQELLEYYERRGYVRTGKKLPFPLNPILWIPKVSHLDLEILEKEYSNTN
jgi:GNAT superfamily N-acetyltransferase